jgi:hypothetical protein
MYKAISLHACKIEINSISLKKEQTGKIESVAGSV